MASARHKFQSTKNISGGREVDTPNNVAIYFNLLEKNLSHCVLAELSCPFKNSDLKVGGQFL